MSGGRSFSDGRDVGVEGWPGRHFAPCCSPCWQTFLDERPNRLGREAVAWGHCPKPKKEQPVGGSRGKVNSGGQLIGKFFPSAAEGKTQ